MAAEQAPVTWPEFIGILSVVVVLVVAVVGGLVRAVIRQGTELVNHRVETATKFQDYVSKDGMREVERRIEESIKALREEFGRGIQTLINLFNGGDRSE